MVKKPAISKKQLLPPPPSISSSDEESPPPPISHATKLSAGPGAAVLQKHTEEDESSEGEEAEDDEDFTEISGKVGPIRRHRAARRVSRITGDERILAASKTLVENVSMDENDKASESEEAEEDEDFTENSGKVAQIRRHRAAGRVSRITDDGRILAATKTLVKNESDKSSEREEEESTDEELSEDVARQPKPLINDREQEVSSTSSSSDSGSEEGEEDIKELNYRAELTHLQLSPPQPARDSANPIADSLLKPPNSSKTVDGGEEKDDSEEEESMADDESSEDFHNTAPKENPPAQPQDSRNVDDDRQASYTSSSSASGLRKYEDIEIPIPDSFLEPLCNKPIESSAQPVEKEPNSWKQAAIFPAKFSKKKRTASIVRAGKGQKKELFKRIWSNEDELVLLQGIMEYKERHHAIPHTLEHTDSLLKSMKDSLSTSFSLNQLNDKVRRMKKRYNNTTIRQLHAKKSKFSDPHNAAVFDLSKKIWDSHKEDSVFFADKITLEKKDEDIAREYPSLYWLLRNEHAKNARTLQNLIPMASAKQFEKKCKELEMMDIQLNMQKMEFLSSAVKLIRDALPKSL